MTQLRAVEFTAGGLAVNPRSSLLVRSRRAMSGGGFAGAAAVEGALVEAVAVDVAVVVLLVVFVADLWLPPHPASNAAHRAPHSIVPHACIGAHRVPSSHRGSMTHTSPGANMNRRVTGAVHPVLAPSGTSHGNADGS